jgi:hypothetical protein
VPVLGLLWGLLPLPFPLAGFALFLFAVIDLCAEWDHELGIPTQLSRPAVGRILALLCNPSSPYSL